MGVDAGALLTSLQQPLMIAAANATSVQICSPFIGHRTAADLAAIAENSGGSSWRLLTWLRPAAAAHGSLSLEGLGKLLKAGVDMADLPRLHAKLFLFDGAVGFAGSANLTLSGLGGIQHPNHELSVVLAEAQRAAASMTFESWWSMAKPVTTTSLSACAKDAARIKVVLKDEITDAPSSRTGDADALLEHALHHHVWVKAEYLDEHQADQPREESRPWIASPRSGRPGFNLGDLILLYAKSTGRCNVVVEATEPSRLDVPWLKARGISDESAERWPWVTPVTMRLQVPIREGVPLAVLGMSGRSLQPGHRRMPVGGLATALNFMCGGASLEL
ncbi:MAG: hypothetical protein JWL79_135 [Frankiales bacterium]|nr:hypothetical protein [Frankiales bacterium]